MNINTNRSIPVQLRRAKEVPKEGKPRQPSRIKVKLQRGNKRRTAPIDSFGTVIILSFDTHTKGAIKSIKTRMMVERKSRFFSVSFLLRLLFLLLSTAIDICSANIGAWSKAGASQSWRRRDNEVDIGCKKNPFAFGLQKALSQSIVGTATPKSIKYASNNIEEDKSCAIRNAFIDDSNEAKEIKYTTKPHLKHTASSEVETHSVTKAKRVTASITAAPRSLLFWESMVSGAVSRSIAQTVMHPANTMKTIMQSSRGPAKTKLLDLVKPQMFRRLSCGAGANFVLSLPHGAFNFAVLESIRERMSTLVDSVPVLERNKERIGPGLDFFSSSIATICCSVVSTPQMMITDVSIPRIDPFTCIVYVSVFCVCQVTQRIGIRFIWFHLSQPQCNALP